MQFIYKVFASLANHSVGKKIKEEYSNNNWDTLKQQQK